MIDFYIIHFDQELHYYYRIRPIDGDSLKHSRFKLRQGRLASQTPTEHQVIAYDMAVWDTCRNVLQTEYFR